MKIVAGVIINFVPLLIAVIAHEMAHGWVAYKRGDDTAKRQKRLSLNPLRHIDPLGSIIIPLLFLITRTGFVIGWAKPVPINYTKLKTPEKDIFLISIAGIIANLYLALISILLLYLIQFVGNITIQAYVGAFLLNMVIINIIIAAFNILPIPPLDGSKIFFGGINKPWAAKYISAEKEGFIAILFLAFILPSFLALFHINFNPLGWYLINTTKFIVSLFL